MSALECPPLKVLFVLPRMVSGGVERVTLNLVGSFRSKGIECLLALRHCRGELMDQAESLVEVREIAGDGMHYFVPRLAALMRDWRPTHVITAFADVGLLTLVAARLAHCDAFIVHGVHNTHGPEARRPGWKGRFRHALDNAAAGLVYRFADAIVAVSGGIGGEIQQKYAVPPERIHTIYNPVVSGNAPAVGQRQFTPNLTRPAKLLALGRLTRQKGFDLLIDAMAQVNRSPPWQLEIHGEGPDRRQLQERIDRLGLRAEIKLMGYVADPTETLLQADIFLLSSRHEGLPTVLIEALASGIPIIATDCPHGPREILLDGDLGMLVPPEDPGSLATAVARALDRGLSFDARAREKRVDDFTLAAAYGRWRDLLDNLRSARSGANEQ